MSGMKDFARLLRRTRERQGVSQAALAVRAGTSQSYVSRVEQGDVAPSLERAARLLRCLGHELDLEARPMSMRDPEGLPESLAMTRRERMVAMAELHNGIAALQEGRRAG
ncbi:MAG: helix-turn-helix transcriptional regulator [Solirubrobacterales bacterium]|nr:helix-turn-helix transcriptional regulator [Solirubrobacterales bacterium]